MQQNPNVELLAMDGDISVRVTGRACFDVTDDMARRIYEGNEVLTYSSGAGALGTVVCSELIGIEYLSVEEDALDRR